MKEAIMEIVEYVSENQEDYFDATQIKAGLTDEEIQEFVMDMDEETFFVTLMLASPKKEIHAV